MMYYIANKTLGKIQIVHKNMLLTFYADKDYSQEELKFWKEDVGLTIIKIKKIKENNVSKPKNI